MSVKICFDNNLAVATITLDDWAPPLVEHLRRYFDVREGMLRLDYSHLSAEKISNGRVWGLTDREYFAFELELAAPQGRTALTLAILGQGFAGIKDSPSILDKDAYVAAGETFRKDVLQGGSRALRETIVAEIAPSEVWVSRLLDAHSSHRSCFLDDQEIMAALVASTSKDNCIDALKLVAPSQGQSSCAFEQLVKQHWEYVRDYIETSFGMPSDHSGHKVPDLVFSLFANSPTVQASRWACEQLLDRADPMVFPRLIEHCRTISADDVRSLFLRWHNRPKTEKKDDLKECITKAYSTLAKLLKDAMPSDLALAAVWHAFGGPARSCQQSAAESLRELPSGAWERKVLWSELGPSAREAWRQDLLGQVRGDSELAQGLLCFACLWLEQTAFAEVEPVLLRLLHDEDHLDFANQLSSAGPRQVQLRAMGLVLSKQGALQLEEPVGEGEDATVLPSVGAQTWLGDPSVERVIHSALSRAEEAFCREYPEVWGEDEEVHTARIVALTQDAVGRASSQLQQLSATTRTTYPSLSVKVRQPGKREEGTVTHAGAPLGADVLFLTRVVDGGITVIQRVTLVQVKKRSGTESGKRFSSTIDIDLQQCENILTQSEHAYYLFATPPSPCPKLWVAPARLVRNLTQLHTSKATVPASQTRDASCSYADFFLHELIGLWAGDEHKDLIALAKGNPLRGRTPRHIVEIEIRRQPN